MKIIKLTLKNFGNIDNSVIEFKNGITLISGQNGSGKSTILKAIALHLFDTYKGKLEDYIKWGSNSFETEIEFEHLNKKFKQTIIYDGNTKRDLYINDNEYYKNSDASKELATKYFDPKLSLASCISFESEIDLISSKPAERRENLKKIYNLDFSKGIKELDEEIKQIESVTLSEIEKKIYAFTNKKYEIKELYKQAISSKDYESYQIKLNENILIKNNFDLKLKEYERDIKDFNNLKNEIEKLKNEEQESLSKKVKYELELTNNKKILEDKISKLLEDIEHEKITYESTPIDFELNNLQKEYDSIIINRNKVFEDSKLLLKEKEFNELNRNLKNIEDRIKLCKSGKCPTCGYNFESSEIEKYETELKLLNITLKSFEQEIVEIKKEREEINKFNELNIETRNKKSILEQKIIFEKSEIENFKKSFDFRIRVLNKEIESTKELYNSKENNLIQNIESLKNNLLEKNYIELNLKQNNLNELSKTISLDAPKLDNSIIESINNYQKIIKDYNEIEIINKKIIEDNSKIVMDKENDSIELNKIIKEKELLIEEIELLKSGKSILLKEFPNYVISNLVKSLENGLNEFIDKTYNGRYKLKIIDKKDSIYIVYGPNEKDCSLASGYEKQIFGLAWKAALGKIQNLGIIILDEIDSAASTENSEILYNVIGSMKDIYNQIFCITHREETKENLRNNYGATILEAIDGKII